MIPLLGTHSKEINSLSVKGTHVFTVVLFTTAMTWKQPMCLSTDEWEKHIYNTLEYYSIIERKETLSFMTTWIDPEGTMLNEMSAKD